jgi:hypothetical protein
MLIGLDRAMQGKPVGLEQDDKRPVVVRPGTFGLTAPFLRDNTSILRLFPPRDPFPVRLPKRSRELCQTAVLRRGPAPR